MYRGLTEAPVAQAAQRLRILISGPLAGLAGVNVPFFVSVRTNGGIIMVPCTSTRLRLSPDQFTNILRPISSVKVPVSMYTQYRTY